MTYSEKLKNPKWQRRRLEILQRDDFTCTLCGDKDTELHIHHNKYTGEPWDAPESDLSTLCKHCHLIAEAVSKITDVDKILAAIKRKHPKGFVVVYVLVKTDDQTPTVCIFSDDSGAMEVLHAVTLELMQSLVASLANTLKNL